MQNNGAYKRNAIISANNVFTPPALLLAGDNWKVPDYLFSTSLQQDV